MCCLSFKRDVQLVLNDLRGLNINASISSEIMQECSLEQMKDVIFWNLLFLTFLLLIGMFLKRNLHKITLRTAL